MHSRVQSLVVLAWDDRWAISIARSFQRLVEKVTVIRVDTKSPREVALEIERLRPDLCFAKNFRVAKISDDAAEEDLGFIFSEWKFPVAMWYLDNPHYQDSPALQRHWQSGRYPSQMLFFYNDPSFSSFFKPKGLPAHHLPIGVDEDIFSVHLPDEEAEWATNLRFTGHPLTSCHLPSLDIPFLIEGFSAFFIQNFEAKMNAGPAMDSLDLEMQIQSMEPALREFLSVFYTQPAEFFAAQTQFYQRCQSLLTQAALTVLRSLESQLGETYSWFQLTAYLRLLVDKGILVQGSEDWGGFFPEQKEACRELTWNELFASYHATKISFCFTKWSLPYAVHDRIYEVFAAGGFPLTDFRQELSKHFEKDELAIYHSIEEARDLIDFYLRHDRERLTILEKGRERVRKQHTYRHRLTQLLDQSAHHFSLGRA